MIIMHLSSNPRALFTTARCVPVYATRLSLQSFGDWSSFGGWTRPAMKQYNDGPSVRGGAVKAECCG